MRPVFLIFLLSFLVNSSWSQEDLLACIDPDVRAGLLNMGFLGGRIISRTLPDQFAFLPESGDFEFIASSDSSQGTIAAFKTDLSIVEGMRAAVANLEDAGWSDADMGRGLGGGFVTENQPQFRLFCRESETISVAIHASDNASFLNLTSISGSGAFPCNEMNSVRAERMPLSAAVARHLPSLTLPEGAEPIGGFGGRGALLASGGGSGGNRSMSFDTVFEAALSAQGLFDHFEPQLEGQDWNRDAGWSGESSSGSTWTANPTDELELSGLLEIVVLSEGGYSVSFRATSLTSE